MDDHIVLALSNSLSDISAALRAPDDEPETAIRFFSRPISRSACHTPISYAPLPPPPARVSAHLSPDEKSSFVITGAFMSSSVILRLAVEAAEPAELLTASMAAVSSCPVISFQIFCLVSFCTLISSSTSASSCFNFSDKSISLTIFPSKIKVYIRIPVSKHIL